MKKNLVRAIAVCAAAIMSVGALSACGGEQKEKLVMGTNAAFPPFEYVTTDGLVGDFDGIDVAIAQKIAEAEGKELEIVDMEFEGLIGAVMSGKIDMAVAGMTVTDERLENVDFSDTYYTAAQVMVVAPDNTDITCAEDIKEGKRVGVVLGYTGDSIVTEDLGVDENNIRRVGRGLDIIQDVKNGKLDVVVIDSATGKALAEANGLKVVEDSEVFETEEYAIAVKKGNSELLNKINTVLKEMKDNGEIDELAVKYNGETVAE